MRNPSNVTLRAQLLAEAMRQICQVPGSDPLVTLEQFFEGNEDYGSLGCNLTPPPGPRFFASCLLTLRNHPTVQDVRVSITDMNGLDSSHLDPSTWLFSDQVYIWTSMSCSEVAMCLSPLQPDEVSEVEENPLYNKRAVAIAKESGVRLYCAWWD